MKRVIAGAAALIVATVGAASATSPEQAARHRDGIPSTIVYHGNYDRMNAKVTCYEGIANHRTNLRGTIVKRGHWVEYCNDGWISIQIKGDQFKDIRP